MAIQLPTPLTAYEYGAVAEIREPTLSSHLLDLHNDFPLSVQHRQLIRQLGSEYVFAKPIPTGSFSSWLVLLRFGEVLEGRFGFTREVPVLYYPFSDLQIRQIDSIEKHLEELPRDRQSVSTAEVLIWADDPRLADKLAHWSSPTRVLIQLPSGIEISGNDPIAHFINSLANRLTSRDLYSTRGYVTGDQFFGRSAELQFLSDCIKSREVVGVFGLRKTGKTSLLHEVIRANRTQVRATIPIEVIIYQDLEYLPSVADDPVPDLVQDIVENLRKALKEHELRTLELSELPRPASLSDFRRALDSLLTKIEGSASITIVLDEIEYLCPPNPIGDTSSEPFQRVRQLFGVFRKLAQERQNFGFVLAGLSSSSIEDSELYGSPNPLFSFARALYLGPLFVHEAGELLNTVGKRVSLLWTDDAVDLAHELSGGHVLLLRELASAVLKNQRHTRTTTTVLKRAHVHAVVSTWRESVASHVREVLPHLRRYYKEEAELAVMLIEDPSSFEEYATLYPANIKRLRELGIVSLDSNQSWKPSKILEFSYEFEQRPERSGSAKSSPKVSEDRPLTLVLDEEESEVLEKKASLLSHGAEIPDEVLIDQVLKACLGFLNNVGGTILVGVNDSNEIVGISPDITKSGSLDKLILRLNTQIQQKIGQVAVGLVSITTPLTASGETIMRIDVKASDRPVFTNKPVDKRTGLFVRNNNSTSLLNDEDAHSYILRHWK